MYLCGIRRNTKERDYLLLKYILDSLNGAAMRPCLFVSVGEAATVGQQPKEILSAASAQE